MAYVNPKFCSVDFVAFKINSAISYGCDTSDAWLEFIESVVAFICSAQSRWISGESNHSN